MNRLVSDFFVVEPAKEIGQKGVVVVKCGSDPGWKKDPLYLDVLFNGGVASVALKYLDKKGKRFQTSGPLENTKSVNGDKTYYNLRLFAEGLDFPQGNKPEAEVSKKETVKDEGEQIPFG